MAVLVGLVLGFGLALRNSKIPFAVVLVAPLLVAALEIIVNAVRFGVGSMVVWAPLLVAMTVGATVLGRLAGRRVGVSRRSQAAEPQ